MICIQFVTFSSLRSLRNCFIFSRVRWLHRLFVMLTYLTKCIYQEKKRTFPLFAPNTKYMSIYLIRIKFYNTNTAMLIVLRETQLCKTSTRHRKNSKQSGM